MGSTVSNLHAKFHRASLIKKRSNGWHTPVPIRLYIDKRQNEENRPKK